MLALSLPGAAASPWWAQQGEATGSSCTPGAGRQQCRGLPLPHGTAGLGDKPYKKSSSIPCLFSIGKASPQASKIPKLLKIFSRHEAAHAGDERGVDHLLNPLRLM